MRKAISMLGWVLVILTMLSLILTMLTTNLVTYVYYCNTYRPFQLLLISTMIIWAIKMFDEGRKAKSLLYSIFCSIIALCTMFFMYMRVY